MRFDNTKPPPAPPNRTGTVWPFIGWVETKESKQRIREYELALERYEPRGVANVRNRQM